MRQIGLLFSLLLALGTGCTRFSTIEVIPSGCVNPASGNCPSSGPVLDSRILELRLYQLKEAVAPCKLDYNVFSDGMDKDFDLLKAQLADPQRKDRVRRVEQIEAAKSKLLARLELLSTTNFLLAVAVGRNRGKNSIRLISKERATEGLTFYIRGTDLCLVSSCESSMEEQCHQ